MKSAEERAEQEIEAIERDESLTEEQKSRAIKDVYDELREILKEERD